MVEFLRSHFKFGPFGLGTLGALGPAEEVVGGQLVLETDGVLLVHE